MTESELNKKISACEASIKVTGCKTEKLRLKRMILNYREQIKALNNK